MTRPDRLPSGGPPGTSPQDRDQPGRQAATGPPDHHQPGGSPATHPPDHHQPAGSPATHPPDHHQPAGSPATHPPDHHQPAGSPATGLPDRQQPGGRAAVEVYLAEIAARLPGPARSHVEIVAELRAGLLDAADAHRSAGLPAAAGAQAAISEFGAPEQVADGFRAEIAARHARRLSASLVACGPLVGLLWVAAAFASHLGLHLAPPWHWPDLPPLLDVGIRLVVVAIVAAAWAALLGIAATGRLTRWLPARPRHGPTVAVIAGFGAASADLILLAVVAGLLVLAPGKLAPLPIALAAAASLTRLTLAARGARQCLAIRATLTAS
jgi:hypothetical protein